jgi:hypothetical protein
VLGRLGRQHHQGLGGCDGKTSPRSSDKKGKGGDPYGVRFRGAPACGARPGQGADKPNEIIAIPPLLDCWAIEGAVVTIDAMGCQRDISQRVIDKKAGYVLVTRG